MPKSSSKKPKRTSTSKSSRKKKKSFFYYIWNYFFKWIFASIGWIFINLWKLLVSLIKRTRLETNKTRVSAQKASKVYGKLTSGTVTSKIRVVETIKGTYSKFWKDLSSSDSRIGIIIGARGSGKSAVALTMLENLKLEGKKFFAMGFPSKELPNWIVVVDNVEEIENDSFVVIDEGGILFSSRNTMSASNKTLSEILFVARHKNLTILFISQNSSNLEINTLRQADFILLKKSSLLQKNFERKIVSDIYDEYTEKFNVYGNIKGISLIYSASFVGFIDNDLPSFWSTKVSKGFRDSKQK
jgi:hypothetical protein